MKLNVNYDKPFLNKVKIELKSGKTGDSSLDESNKSSESDKTQSRRDEQTLVAAALCFVRHNFKKFVRNY